MQQLRSPRYGSRQGASSETLVRLQWSSLLQYATYKFILLELEDTCKCSSIHTHTRADIDILIFCSSNYWLVNPSVGAQSHPSRREHSQMLYEPHQNEDHEKRPSKPPSTKLKQHLTKSITSQVHTASAPS